MKIDTREYEFYREKETKRDREIKNSICTYLKINILSKRESDKHEGISRERHKDKRNRNTNIYT